MLSLVPGYPFDLCSLGFKLTLAVFAVTTKNVSWDFAFFQYLDH
jgi:hypothetical protein